MAAGTFDNDYQPNRGVCSFTLVSSAVLAYFFAQYTFKNPDIFQCVANSSLMPEFGGGNEYTDVTQRFKIWFECGFILNCVGILYSILALIQILVKDRRLGEMITRLVNVGSLLVMVVTIAWVITGTIFRWNHHGKVCSGDYVDQTFIDAWGHFPPYQWKSGKFMRIYLIILYSIFGLMCCCGVGLACCL